MKDIKEKMSDIPSNVVIVKVDYDTAKNMKKLWQQLKSDNQKF